jgi:hypothetical protein
MLRMSSLVDKSVAAKAALRNAEKDAITISTLSADFPSIAPQK